MRKSRKVDESKFDFIEEYAKAVEEAEATSPVEETAEESVEETAEVAETAGKAAEAAVDAEEAVDGAEAAGETAPDHVPFENIRSEQVELTEADELMEEDEDDEEEIDINSPEYKRTLRHKRRVRNQILAYISMLLILLIIGGGIAYGAYTLKGVLDSRKAEEEAARLQAEAEAQTQQEIVIEPPESVVEQTEPEEAFEEEEVVEEEVDYLEEMVVDTISQMTIEDKVAQLFMITPESLTGVAAATKAGEGTRDALGQYAVGGLVYDRKNIESEDQLTELIENTRNMSKYDLFLAITEAGGEYSVLSGSSLGDIPAVDSPADIAAGGDTSNAYNAGVTISSYMSYFGFNLDMAPNGSMTTDEASVSAAVSYGADEAVATDMISQMISGLQTGKVNACITDFPGTGTITEKTADGKVESELSADELSAQMLPYITGTAAGARLVRINNVTYTAADASGMPASLSEYVIGKLLRGDMAFDGVVVTAPLNEKAITENYTSAEAAVYALTAGADILYMPDNFEEAYNGLLEAVSNGTIPESRIDESLDRIFRVKLSVYID
ncbi:MAG: beta-N-acetylhexosaminidase [Lachnospiraceae bacterium]|nr:beta-N-acetylhexosaminidase [Lachnospiraceae bacterium]